MRVEEKLTNYDFLNLYKVTDDDGDVPLTGYYYAERIGKDSVAFICFDKDDHTRVLLNKEFKPPIGHFMLGAFGGSNDKDLNFKKIVIQEVKEEAGYTVTEDDVIKVSDMFVSNMMNQYCCLYAVFVDADQDQEREPQNKVEAAATTEWHTLDKIDELDDWKALTIYTKAKQAGILDI
jgi:8-oxo-dGTP pyrophosphatase MutT (NUDIX family)